MRALTLILIYVIPTLVICQEFYDGTAVHILAEKGSHKVKKCKLAGPICYGCTPRFKSISKKRGKWTRVENRIFIDNSEFNQYQFGEISVLVSRDQLSNFFQKEELCQSAVLSIPYEQFNFDNTNSVYAPLRDKLIAHLQYIRIKGILNNLIGADLWIEVPNGHSDQDLCKKNRIAQR